MQSTDLALSISTFSNLSNPLCPNKESLRTHVSHPPSFSLLFYKPPMKNVTDHNPTKYSLIPVLRFLSVFICKDTQKY